MKLGTKLLLTFLCVGVIPFSVIGVISMTNSTNALSGQAFGQLESMRAVKKNQIENFFAERKGDMGVLVEIVGTLRKEAFEKLNAVMRIKKNQIKDFFKSSFAQMAIFARSADVSLIYEELSQYHMITGATETKTFDVNSDTYKQLYDQFGANINQFRKDNGYYDILIICAEHGHVMYTAAKQADLGTNLKHGPHKKSGLAKLWSMVAKSGQRYFVDFEPYAPSNNDPAAFIGYPIRDLDGHAIGVIAFQLSIDHVNHIMHERTGLGKTGETYLVGADKLMRSDSYLDPTNHSAKASFADPAKGSVDTQASRKALSGESGQGVIMDYNNRPVLSCWDAVNLGDGIRWAMISEIAVVEAFNPTDIEGKEFYATYTQKYGYDNLFLFNPDGYCFYTVAKGADDKTNLVNGKYADSGLGKVVRHVLGTKQFGISDFEPYAPSNGEPAAFMAQPVVHNDIVEVVVGLQLSLDAINRVMLQRQGMGEAGETYLVGQDKLMRSDSYLDPTNHSVKASFADPTNGSVDTEASREALSGITDEKVGINYNGNAVLSSYTPVAVGGTTWALMAEIDEAEAFAAVNTLKWLIGIVAACGIVAIIGVALLITQSITQPINRIIKGLNDGADQVSSASGQVSSSSQSLAEGASEQAASIEETSSSLEEMSSMTKQNADSSHQADRLMKEANLVVGQANDSMAALTESMGEITIASEETSKIIKTIDEIAFQTNLLALNAAVEAARAGEAGAGFAVVADEVRNLAMRAAEAARNTAGLIEETVKKVKDGAEIVTRTNESFGLVAESASKVGELVSEISAASNEQAQGIEQVNRAVVEMDKITQQNATNAEESAAASEEMNAQADTMKRIVNDLVELIGVHATGSTGAEASSEQTAKEDFHHALSVPRTKSEIRRPPGGEIKPDLVIPLDDDDFEDF